MITDTRAVHGLVSAANWVQIWNSVSPTFIYPLRKIIRDMD